jgi:hypothetical protein
MIIDFEIRELLMKLVLLGAPAAGLLLWLKIRKPQSPILYFISCTNLFSYTLWLSALSFEHSMAFYRWSTELRNSHFLSYTLPLWAMLFWPFCATVFSFIFVPISITAKPGEHRFLVPANILLFLLWLYSFILVESGGRIQ